MSFFDKLTDAVMNPAALQKAQVPNFIARAKASLASDPATAIKLLSMAVKADPDNVEAWATLAGAHSESEQTKEAADAYRKLVDLQPDSSAAYLGLGTELLTLERYEEAERTLMHGILLAQSPDAVDLYNLALTFYRQNLEGQAIPFCQMALNLGADPDTEELLADCLYALDAYEEAMTHYQNALKGNPSNPHNESNLGFCLEMLGRHQEAVPILLRALEHGAVEPEVYGSLSRCYESLGETESAKQMADKYYELAPQTDETEDQADAPGL